MQREHDLDLAVIGNCTWAGLLDRRARLVWGCLPRFDSDPVFCSLLRGGDEDAGLFAIELEDFARSESAYVGHTAIVRTVLYDTHGGAIEITDFAPRFSSRGRTYRPTMMMRRVTPLAGDPRIRIVLRPLGNYGREKPPTTRGSNHIRFITPGIALRLTTDAPSSASRSTSCSAPTRPSPRPSRAQYASTRSARATTGCTGCAGSRFPSSGRTQ